MDALDLNVEQRRRVDNNASRAADTRSEGVLVRLLDAVPAVLKRGVVGVFIEFAQPGEIGHPAFADRFIEQRCKALDCLAS